MIDFHCHLDLYPDPRKTKEECIRRGLEVLSVTTTPSAWKGTSALAASAPGIRTALGLHPQLAGERHTELDLFDRLLPDTRYVGEIGLDGAPEFRRHWRSQVLVFEHILGRCRDADGRILSLHSRRASGAVLDRLEAFAGAGVPILHWFSGSGRELERAIGLGCWFSVGPAMLKSKRGRSLAASMPRDRVLTESDGPFAQVAGNTVMPWHVEDAVRELRQIWSMPVEAVNQTIGGNLKKLLAS